MSISNKKKNFFCSGGINPLHLHRLCTTDLTLEVTFAPVFRKNIRKPLPQYNTGAGHSKQIVRQANRTIYWVFAIPTFEKTRKFRLITQD